MSAGHRVTKDGQTIVVPPEIYAEGGQQLDDYVEVQFGRDKPLARMNRAELDAEAEAVGLDPAEYGTVDKLREAVKEYRE